MKLTASIVKRPVALLLAAALAAALIGCSSSTYERRTDMSSTLYVGKVFSAFPTSFMPWMSRDGIAPTLSGMLFETLLDYDESEDSFSPLLCKSWYFIDHDGNPIQTEQGEVDYARLEEVYGGPESTYMTARFELDEGAAWSDGEPVTVEDVYFTLDLAENQAMSNHAGALVWTNDLLHKYDNGRLRRQGIFTYDRGAGDRGYNISEADRDRVFYLEFNKVLGAVATLCSTTLILPKHIYAPIISEDNPINSTSPTAELKHAYTHPVGSGPYVLDAQQSNAQQIVIRRRDDYHIKAPDGGTLYSPETIKFILYQDINVAIYALKKGHIDVLVDSMPTNYAPLFAGSPGVVSLKTEGLFDQTLVINMNPPKDYSTPARERLKDSEFRKAIGLAIDQEELIRQVLDGMGSVASLGMVKQSAEFYNPDVDGGTAPIGERVAEANRILDGLYPQKDKDGYRLDNGRRLTYEILTSTAYQDLVAYLQVLFQKIGIEVRFGASGASPESTYFYVGNFDMTITGVVLNASNMDVMYNAHFVNLTRSSNYGRLVDPAFKSRIDTMRTTLNRDLKYELAKELQVLTAGHYYKIPLYRADILSVARTDRFTGWLPGMPGETAFNPSSLQAIRMVGS